MTKELYLAYILKVQWNYWVQFFVVILLHSVEIPFNIVEIIINSVKILLNIVEIILNSVKILLNIVGIILNSVEIPLNIVEIILNSVKILLNIVGIILYSVESLLNIDKMELIHSIFSVIMCLSISEIEKYMLFNEIFYQNHIPLLNFSVYRADLQ